MAVAGCYWSSTSVDCFCLERMETRQQIKVLSKISSIKKPLTSAISKSKKLKLKASGKTKRRKTKRRKKLIKK